MGGLGGWVGGAKGGASIAGVNVWVGGRARRHARTPQTLPHPACPPHPPTPLVHPETCAAAYGGAVAVWATGSAGSAGGAREPKALWKAHDALITCLHRSAHGLHLFSGAADGTLHM